MYIKKVFALILILGFMFMFMFLFLFSCFDSDNIINTNQPNLSTAENNENNTPQKKYDLNVVYKTVNNIDLLMDIYYPINIKYDKSPLVVGFHGGGWIAGDKTQLMYIFSPIIQELLSNGYTVAMPQYRFAEEPSYFPAQIEDCIDAISYLKNNDEEYNINADSIGVMGYSAGAQLAMLASYADDEFFNCVTPGDIKYCLSFAGPTKMYGEELNDFPNGTIQLVENLFNKPYDPEIDNYVTGSPYFYLEYYLNSKVPLFICQDEYDNVVPFRQAEVMYNKAIEKDIPCELLKLNGFYHQIDFGYDYNTKPSRDEIVKTVLDFIYKYS